MRNPDHERELERYYIIAKRLRSNQSPLEKMALGEDLVEILRSKNVSLRRCAKYNLRKYFSSNNIPESFSRYGPPEPAEVIYWENRFQTNHVLNK